MERQAEDYGTKKMLSLDIGNEFTLEDTYDYLKDIQDELDEEMKRLILNTDSESNDIKTLSPHLTTIPDYIEMQEQKLVQELLNHEYKYDVRIDPIPNTIDAYKSVIWELKQEVIATQKMFDSLKAEIIDLQNNIKCLENQKKTIESMKETCQNATERNNTGTIIDDAEILIAKKIFISLKNDLASTVEILFPDHKGLKDLLADLTSAYTNGAGDEVYIDVNPTYMDCVQFMVESDIATYHRNDKNKIRLMDLL